MKRTPSMVSLVKDYLNCRRKLGVDLLREGSLLLNLARFVDNPGVKLLSLDDRIRRAGEQLGFRLQPS